MKVPELEHESPRTGANMGVMTSEPGGLDGAAEREVALQAEVNRLTAALAEAVVSMLDMCDDADKAEARERKLRAITGEMRWEMDKTESWDHFTVNEWDRRAGEVT